MKYTRWFSLALTLSLVVGLLGPAVASAQQRTVTFWHYWDGNNNRTIQNLAQQYEFQTGTRVRLEMFPYETLLQKLQAAMAGGQGPDVAIADLAWMAKFTRSGALQPLDELIARDGVDVLDFYPSLLEYDRDPYGQLVALPVSTNNLGLFYNKDMFAAAGLDPERPPRTWSELREMAKWLTTPDGMQMGFEVYTQTGEGLTWNLQPYIWQKGAEYLTDGNSRAGFNNEQGIAAVRFLTDLLQTDRVATPGKWGLFGKGQAAMVVDGSWMVGIFKEQVPFNFGTAWIPYADDGQPATNMGGEHIYVLQGAGDRDAAWDFVRWLTSTEVQVVWDIQTTFMPVRSSVALDESFRLFLALSEPRLIPFVEQQQYARPRPPVPQYPETSTAFSKAIEQAYFGVTSPEQAVADAAAAVDEILSSGLVAGATGQ